MAGDYSPTIRQRILSKCKRAENGCLEFTGFRMPNGYGQIGRGRAGAGMSLVHRAMWEITNGPIPEGMFVCHQCDNPGCCEITHLFLGTPADNTHDMLRKKREHHPAGTLHAKSKLTDADVIEIRRLGKTNMTRAEIGRRFGITGMAAGQIILRKRWNTTEHTLSLGA